MSLPSGSRLGPYEIVAPLGAGGMGEVYRARDTRLDRSVAVKVLPPLLSSSPDARQRFEREAKAISKLSHPHICALYDIGRDGETDYLVMELLEGETLSARLARGPLPLEQTLRCGVEIAGALEKAHRLGIVHRDLKPGNVMLTKSGVKLLDFGLAKVLQPAPPLESLTSAPTAAKDITREGTILGTLQYMAPEQLEGREVDPRTDVFALGCVLYEMATGRKAFAGASQASVIAAILAAPPPPISSSRAVPRSLDRVVQTCLARDPDDRWQSAGDVGKELAWVAQDPSAEPAAARKSRPVLPWIVAAAAIAIGVAGLALGLFSRPRAAPSELTRFSILPPAGNVFLGGVELSPDARRAVFLLHDAGGKTWLGLRSFDSLGIRRLPGTDDANGMFWSPDGREIAFFSEAKLKRMPAEGGPAQTICDAGGVWTGDWNRAGTILLPADFGGPLLAVPASGGQPRPVTTLDSARGEIWHAHPRFLPDGRHFVFVATNVDPEKTEVELGSLDSKEVRRLFHADSSAFFAEPGFLLFGKDGTLFASRFDPQSLKLLADPFPVFERVRVWRVDNLLAASAAGNRIAYLTWSARRRLVWLDRKGRELGSLGDVGAYTDVRVSPDGRRVAAARRDPAHGENQDIWVLDAGRGTAERLTSEGWEDFNPTWSPDGENLLFVSGSAAFDIHQRPASGGADQVVAASSKDKVWPSLSPDGRQLLVAVHDKGVFQRLLIPIGGAAKPAVLSSSPRFSEEHPMISPDGRWSSFDSNESGERNVYVQPLAGGPRRQVSIGGGEMAIWNRSGSELFYIARDGTLMSVTLRAGTGGLEIGEPQPLFPLQLGTQGELPWVSRPYDVSPDGQRFLVIRRASDTDPEGAVVVTNWTSLLGKP